MSVKEYNEMKAKETTDEEGEIVYPYVVKLGSAAARKWVKEGNPHNTPLYIDNDGKVRYAKDMEN
jgi:hypothetical protein